MVLLRITWKSAAEKVPESLLLMSTQLYGQIIELMSGHKSLLYWIWLFFPTEKAPKATDVSPSQSVSMCIIPHTAYSATCTDYNTPVRWKNNKKSVPCFLTVVNLWLWQIVNLVHSPMLQPVEPGLACVWSCHHCWALRCQDARANTSESPSPQSPCLAIQTTQSQPTLGHWWPYGLIHEQVNRPTTHWSRWVHWWCDQDARMPGSNMIKR